MTSFPTSRLSARAWILAGVAISAATAACSSLLGEFKAGAAEHDGGEDGAASEGGEDSGPVNVTAVAVGSTVYLGQTATLDGTGSSVTGDAGPLTFFWNLTNIPPNSQLGTSNLSPNNTSPKVTFTPDVIGTYTFDLAVTADGTTEHATADVSATGPQVFFAQGTISDAGPSATYLVASYDAGEGGAGGWESRAVVCADTFVSSVPNEVAGFAAYAGRAYDFWEPPDAAQSTRFAALTIDFQSPNAYTPHLWTGTASTGCDAGTLSLGQLTPSGKPFASTPHFSPDGSRIALYDPEWQIVTYAVDGSNSHVVAKYSIAPSQGAALLDPVSYGSNPNYIYEPPRIEWTAQGSLAWAQPATLDAGTGWAVVVAEDAQGATPQVYMSCPGTVPRQISMYPDGSVIAAYRPPGATSDGIFKLKVGTNPAMTCSPQIHYTPADATGAIATDFSLSPDSPPSTIAFLQLDPSTAAQWDDGGLPGGTLYTVGINSDTPTKVASSISGLYGPRWVQGGNAIVLTRLDGVAEGGVPAASVVVYALDGGQSVLAHGDGVSTFVSTSGSGACDVDPGAARSGNLVAVGLAAVAGLAHRRRRARARGPGRRRS